LVVSIRLFTLGLQQYFVTIQGLFRELPAARLGSGPFRRRSLFVLYLRAAWSCARQRL
jgi:hypothetical protein